MTKHTSAPNMAQLKELYLRIKRELDDRLQVKGREEGETEKRQPKKRLTEAPKCSDCSDTDANTGLTDDASLSSSSLSCGATGSNPQQSATGRKRARYTSVPSSLTIIESSATPLSSSLYSSMKLPVGCLAEYDGCDEAEILARAKRCQEIMKLSQQAKEAEAARAKAEAAKAKTIDVANALVDLCRR